MNPLLAVLAAACVLPWQAWAVAGVLLLVGLYGCDQYRRGEEAASVNIERKQQEAADAARPPATRPRRWRRTTSSTPKASAPAGGKREETITSELVVFIITVLGALGAIWARIEAIVSRARTEAMLAANSASSKADIVASDLAAHRLHVAEHYVDKAGLRGLPQDRSAQWRHAEDRRRCHRQDGRGGRCQDEDLLHRKPKGEGDGCRHEGEGG